MKRLLLSLSMVVCFAGCKTESEPFHVHKVQVIRGSCTVISSGEFVLMNEGDYLPVDGLVSSDLSLNLRGHCWFVDDGVWKQTSCF